MSRCTKRDLGMSRCTKRDLGMSRCTKRDLGMSGWTGDGRVQDAGMEGCVWGVGVGSA